jgi:hypothetical protein
MSSAHRQLLLLVALSFLFATMISMTGYSSKSMSFGSSSQSVVLTENEKRALSRYFAQYVLYKRTRLEVKAPEEHRIKTIDVKRDTHLQPSSLNQGQLRTVSHANRAPQTSLSTAIREPIIVKSIASTQTITSEDGASNELGRDGSRDRISLSIDSDRLAQLIREQKVTSSKRQRDQMITLAEVQSALHYKDNKTSVCWHNHGLGLALLVMVISSPVNFQARQSIRDTWGGFAVERGAKLLFVTGEPESDGLLNSRQTLRQLLHEEDGRYGDMLQGKFVDSYDNLTLKSLSMLNWVSKFCNATKYVFKVDDDMFINMQLLVDFAEMSGYKNVLIGKIAKQWLPHRNRLSKYYVSYAEFNQTQYPNFATGPAYMVTGDAVPRLLSQATSGLPIMRLEDVFVTGVLAERAAVRRLNYYFFKNVHFKVNQCNFPKFITSHRHAPDEIVRLWSLVYRVPAEDCVKKTSIKPAINKIEGKKVP